MTAGIAVAVEGGQSSADGLRGDRRLRHRLVGERRPADDVAHGGDPLRRPHVGPDPDQSVGPDGDAGRPQAQRVRVRGTSDRHDDALSLDAVLAVRTVHDQPIVV
jgi:hypothetical protein